MTNGKVRNNNIISMENIFRKIKRKHIYVILNTDTNRIKIGITDDIKTCVCALQLAGGCKLDVKYLSPAIYDAQQVEKQIHKHFSEFRHLGEWFNIDYKDAIRYIKRRYKDFGKYIASDKERDNQDSTCKAKPLDRDKEKKEVKYEMSPLKDIKENEVVIVEEVKTITTKVIRTKDYPFSRWRRVGKNIYQNYSGERKRIFYKDGYWNIEDI